MSTNTPSGSEQASMDLLTNLMNPDQDNQVTWIVMPYLETIAFGVPLYGYWKKDKDFVYTGVPAVDGLTPVTPTVQRKFGAPTEMADISFLLEDLEDSAPIVIDSVMAYLAHRPIEKPGVPDDQINRIDPRAGYLPSSKAGKVPAVLVATHGLGAAALYIDMSRTGAEIRMSWVKETDFTHDPAEFNNLSKHLELDDFLKRLSWRKEVMAVNGVEVLLKDPHRMLPDLLTLSYLFTIIDKLGRTEEARARANYLIGELQERFDGIGQEGLEYYVSAMCELRGLLPATIDTRIPGKESGFEKQINAPSWVRLFDAIVRNLTQLAVQDLVDKNATELTIRNALHRLAATVDDPFTLAMTTPEARVVSAVAQMAAHPEDPKSTDDRLMKYLRRMFYIAGPVEWGGARPYDRGVMWAVLGHTYTS